MNPDQLLSAQLPRLGFSSEPTVTVIVRWPGLVELSISANSAFLFCSRVCRIKKRVPRVPTIKVMPALCATISLLTLARVLNMFEKRQLAMAKAGQDLLLSFRELA